MRYVSTLILILLVAALSLTLVQQASAYTVEAAHPRVWLTDHDEIKGKCNSAMSADYDPWKTWIDANFLGDSYPLATNEGYVNHAETFAILHTVEGATDSSYYHEAKLMFAYVWAQANWHQDPFYMRALAICYDQMHADLVTQGLDDNWGDSLAVAVEYNAQEYTNYAGGSPAHTNLTRLIGPATGGIALYGDGHGVARADGDASAIAACDTFMKYAFDANRGGCAMADSIARDGGFFQGDYNRDGLWDFAQSLWIFENGATDVAATDSSSCLTNWIDYIVWDTTCEKNDSLATYAFGFGKQSDSYTHGGGRDDLRHIVNMLTTAYQDPNGMWLQDQFVARGIGIDYRYGVARYLAYHDTSLAAISPVTASWPIAKHYEVGTVYLRNGWDMEQTTSTDVWAVYRHEQYPFGHATADAGHFCIFRGDDLLLIDAGYYDGGLSDHHIEYFSQTIAHTAITIKKTGETFAEATENTGGQNYLGGAHPTTVTEYATYLAGDVYRGNITDFSVVGDTLAYIRSDLTEAYLDSKVDTVRREFVWMEPKNTFLIFDTVKTTGVSAETLEQKQLFHMIDNPTTTTATARWTNGGSQAKITSLFGTGDVTLTEVGGAGHHFDCNGTNYGSEGVYYDEGRYRIELKCGQSDSQRWMLTAVQVTAEADTSYSTLTLLTEGSTYIGAAVDSDTILFHKYGGAYKTSGGEPPETPVLSLDPGTLNFTYAEPDSHSMKFGISNSGDGILNWETTNICDWLSDSCVDTGTVGVGTDSVTVEVKWAQIATDATVKDTVVVGGDDSGQVVINAVGPVSAVTIDPGTLAFTYADSAAQKFGIGNTGDGILSWESSFLSGWIADAANDTGTVGAGYDSVTVQLMWAQVDSGAAWSDTVAVTGGGDGQVLVTVAGKPGAATARTGPPMAQRFKHRGFSRRGRR